MIERISFPKNAANRCARSVTCHAKRHGKVITVNAVSVRDSERARESFQERGNISHSAQAAPQGPSKRCRIIPYQQSWGEHDVASETRQREELVELVELLPSRVASILKDHPQLDSLVEVVMDLGRKPVARLPEGDVVLSDAGITAEELEEAIEKVSLLFMIEISTF